MTSLAEIRATRVAPPGRASDDPERRRTFAAALEQFEQLFNASETTKLEARPLPLFYALSQAGRAIAAAHHEVGGRVRGHGLTEASIVEPILKSRIRPLKNRGLFGAMADLNDSSGLTDEVELGALWASLPEDTLLCDGWPPAMRVWIPGLHSRDPYEQEFAHIRAFGVVVPPCELTPQQLVELMPNYPGSKGARPHVVQGLWPVEQTPIGDGYRFSWVFDDSSSGLRDLVRLLPQHRFRKRASAVALGGRGTRRACPVPCVVGSLVRAVSPSAISAGRVGGSSRP